MKRMIIIAVLIVAALSTVAAYMKPQNNKAGAKDSRGHVLVKEWEKLADAQAKDRPQLQEEIAYGIIEQSKARHLAWDFYDAWEQYRQVKVRRNWKESAKVSEAFGEDVKAFGDPLVTFLYNERFRGWNRDEAVLYAKDCSAALKAARNDVFYRYGSISYHLGEQLPSYISNDYEFVLWECGALDALKEYLGDSYPNGAYAEYLDASRSFKDSEKKLQAVAQKYKGKAVGLYPEADLLRSRLSRMQNEDKATSAEYRDLYSECQAFEKVRRSFSGKESAIVKNLVQVQSMAKELSSSSLRIFVDGDTVSVITRNMRSVKISVAEKDDPKKVVHKDNIVNKVGSFYVQDTLKTVLPKVNDGEYVVEASGEGEKQNLDFSRHTLSLAYRHDSEGTKVYAADYISGEPLQQADLVLTKNGSEVRKAEGFRFDGGFTALPADMASMVKGNSRYVLSCVVKEKDGIVRKSPALSLYAVSGSDMDRSTRQYCNVYLNMGAFHPGDTVKFKGILYEGNLVDEVCSAGKGLKVNASVLDSERNKVEELELVTNEFGSVAGEFVIPAGLRNGVFTLELSSGRYHGTASFRVDEFVLPTYEISFEPIDRLIFPGDVITFKGKVVSYSGHIISDATATYELSGSGESRSGELTLAADGSFTLDVETSAKEEWDYGWQMYEISVKVTDATGETQEARYGVSIQRRISVDLKISETISADFEMTKEKSGYLSSTVVDADMVKVRMDVTSVQNGPVETSVVYKLMDENDKVLTEGEARSGDVVPFDLSSYGSGIYSIHADAFVVDGRGEKVKAERTLHFLKVSENDRTLDAPLKNYYRTFGKELESGEKIKAQLGTADGPVWAVVELFGDGRKLLERRMVVLKGDRGQEGSLETMEFEYKASYPDAVLLQIFYFKDGSTKTFNTQFHRRRHTLDLPLSWERFEDKTMPGSPYSFVLRTSPSAEILASIYDRSVDRISTLYWNTVSMREFNVPSVIVSAVCGSIRGNYPVMLRGSRMMKSAGPMVAMSTRAKEAVFEEDAVMLDGAESELMMNGADVAMDYMEEESAAYSAGSMEADAVTVREDFSTSLAFEPFLRSDKDGRAELKFRTSDKLSSFNVLLFAHDKGMRNNLVRKEMVVSIPVKVSVLEPQYLYVGDKYEMAVSVSSISDQPLSGTLWLYQYDGSADGKPVKVTSTKIMVPASGSASQQFDVAVPDAPGERGLKAVFVSEEGVSGAGFSDAVYVSVPVLANVQTVTEAHSVVLLPGMDEKSEAEKLRKAFVNVSSYGAESKEISIIDMVKAAVPSSVEPDNDDVLTLTEAYYVRKMAASLGVTLDVKLGDDKLIGKILSCRNADGGFGWYEGMESSPVITAVVLERFAKLERAGYGTMDLVPSVRERIPSAVKYLDNSYFHIDRPYWCGGISAAQYLYVRSLYANVPFEVKVSGSEQEKLMKNFRKYVKEYLVPKGERGLDGQILDKARRLRTLASLVSSDEGIALAEKWGVSLGARRKMLSSLEDDVVSLLEYAVDHKDGGMYYPNAVMPFRGLLESEAYAHSLICDLFTDYAGGFASSSSGSAAARSDRASEALRIADGIRIWLMLQKETQKWGEEPAFVDAVHSVMEGSDAVKATKVLVLSKTYEKPFREIKAAGNGFTIERKFFLNGEEVQPGAALKVGDRIRVEYRVWNGENRSFVVLRAPREATLRPVQQLSGMYGWGIRPLRVGSWFSFQPHGYRNVKAAVTEYYFDTYPEEDSTISEEFYVTQAGSFHAPAIEIESLYSPHYRANAGYLGDFPVK